MHPLTIPHQQSMPLFIFILHWLTYWIPLISIPIYVVPWFLYKFRVLFQVSKNTTIQRGLQQLLSFQIGLIFCICYQYRGSSTDTFYARLNILHDSLCGFFRDGLVLLVYLSGTHSKLYFCECFVDHYFVRIIEETTRQALSLDLSYSHGKRINTVITSCPNSYIYTLH